MDYRNTEGESKKIGKSDSDCIVALSCPLHGRATTQHYFPSQGLRRFDTMMRFSTAN